MRTFSGFFKHLAGAAAVLAFGVGAASAATIQVNTTAQFAATAEDCTLSDAIHAAHLDQPVRGCAAGSFADTIILPAGVYTLTTPAADDGYGDATGLPPITGIATALTIEGAGAGLTIIERRADAPPFRLFHTSAFSFELRDLTLRGGDAGSSSVAKGGAIHVADINPIIDGAVGTHLTVRRVTFENNHARHGGGISTLGYVYGKSMITLEDTRFLANVAIDGGGALQVERNATVVISRSEFADNAASAWGGAIADLYGASLTVTDTQFLRNSATQTGGAMHATSPRLTRVSFRENTAGREGLAGFGGALHSSGRPIIADSTFSANRATRGGAIDVSGGSVEIRGSTFTANVATGAGNYRDGGSALLLDDRSHTSLISNSTFSGNISNAQGAIKLVFGTLTVTNTTIAFNRALAGEAFWSEGITLGVSDYGTLRVSNSIIAKNGYAGTPRDLSKNTYGTIVSLGHNLIGVDEFTGGAFGADGDVAGTPAEPLDPGLLLLGGNGGSTETHALAPGSPALDGGSTALAGQPGACEAADQRGRRRPGAGTGTCDIGAFEHQITFPLSLVVGAGGSVVGLNGAVACTGTCTADVDSGTIVKLEATANEGAEFVGWLGGGCNGSAALCFVTMAEAQTVTATFRTISSDTTSRLTSSPNPSVHGQVVALTAVVAPVGTATGAPTGSVNFRTVPDGVDLGTVTVDAAGSAALSYQFDVASGITRQIRAIYLGDGTFNVSEDSVSHTVQRANTSIALTPLVAYAVSGEPVTFTALVSAVAPGAGIPSGTVRFRNLTTGVTLDTVSLDGTGTAAITTSALVTGLHSIEAFYTGAVGDPTPLFEQSTMATLAIITAGSTTTALTSSLSPALSGKPVTFTAKVEAVAPATGIPTGTVIFVNRDTGQQLGNDVSVIDAAGYATVLTADLPEGTDTIEAFYDGNTAFGGSSGTVTQVTLPSVVTLEVPEVVLVSDTVVPLAAEMLTVSETVLVSDTVTPLPAEMLTVAETVWVSDDIDPEVQNTSTGRNILLRPADPVTGSTAVTIQFFEVVRAGLTIAARSAVPPPPDGFEHTVPPESYELSTTATVAGGIEVCIAAPPAAVDPRLMHFELNAWVDRTASVDPVTNRVCGSVSSLSPFAVFVPVALEGRMTGHGAVDPAKDHRFEFRLVERSIGTERGALEFEVKTPKVGKQKARTDKFRSTDITAIAFRDDPSFRPGHRRRPDVDSVVFSGVGTWNGAADHSFTARATDHGEPGRGRDTFEITVRDANGVSVAAYAGTLTVGNIQSLRLRRR